VGISLYLKRREEGKFIWPVSRSGEAVQISAVQLGYLLEGIDWHNPHWTQRPETAGQIAPAGLFIGVLRPRLLNICHV
jgi:transposase